MSESSQPPDRQPSPWARLVGFVITLLYVAAIVGTSWFVGYALDALLTSQLGELESKLTAWTVLLTLILCLWSRHRHRTTDRGEQDV